MVFVVQNTNFMMSRKKGKKKATTCKRPNRLLKYFQAMKLVQFPTHNLFASVQN